MKVTRFQLVVCLLVIFLGVQNILVAESLDPANKLRLVEEKSFQRSPEHFFLSGSVDKDGVLKEGPVKRTKKKIDIGVEPSKLMLANGCDKLRAFEIEHSNICVVDSLDEMDGCGFFGFFRSGSRIFTDLATKNPAHLEFLQGSRYCLIESANDFILVDIQNEKILWKKNLLELPQNVWKERNSFSYINSPEPIVCWSGEVGGKSTQIVFDFLGSVKWTSKSEYSRVIVLNEKQLIFADEMTGENLSLGSIDFSNGKKLWEKKIDFTNDGMAFLALGGKRKLAFLDYDEVGKDAIVCVAWSGYRPAGDLVAWKTFEKRIEKKKLEGATRAVICRVDSTGTLKNWYATTVSFDSMAKSKAWGNQASMLWSQGGKKAVVSRKWQKVVLGVHK